MIYRVGNSKLEIEFDTWQRQFRVTKQNFRGSDNQVFEYTARNGMQIWSCNMPEYIHEDRKLYVRGNYSAHDNLWMYLPSNAVSRELAIRLITEAVQEFTGWRTRCSDTDDL